MPSAERSLQQLAARPDAYRGVTSTNAFREELLLSGFPFEQQT